ncbi:hypothetical protein GCM10007147_42230 [Nocardiopsis kunsanensis]|uniref:SGNH hydrolase-type esterase domain-containing protein n=1 Tax=Nocardiopsis kunsanensis TaxID=141693 RepID=A0A918XL79_9ACTN|nr:SGNH/GDSL hydrolase family protein [Nocardiopsis kunsanensis]GHD35627.1 hypothetical protein GCM10007147_42230 [Nocardiopsis kunsanensis]
MSTRGDDPSDFDEPEHGPGAVERGRDEQPDDGTGGAPAHGNSGAEQNSEDSSAEQTSEGSGATAVSRPSRKRPRTRRARIALYSAAALVLLLVVTMAVPATRDGVTDLWCDLTGGVCPGDPPPLTEEEQQEELDWRVRVEPEEAALWGNYVALGDSYSSGDGAGDYDPSTAEPGGCWRSENAYPRLISEEYEFSGTLAFFACSSHKGEDMLSRLGTPESQIERVTDHTSLVTIGIGGNDLGFIPVLRTCMVRMPILDNTACVDQEEEISDRMEQFEETLTQVLEEIHDRAPDARILVVGYPRLFPEEPTGMYYTLSVNDQEWLNTVARRFNETIRDTVYRVDGDVYGERDVGSAEYVNVFSSLNGYEVSADEAWLNGIVLGELGEGLEVDRASFHPTAEGQMSMAERVRSQIEEGPERTLYVTRETLEQVDQEILRSELGGPLDPVGPEEEVADGGEAEEAGTS